MSDSDPSPYNETVVTVVGPPKLRTAGPSDACLVVIYGDDIGRRIPLGRQPAVIGRSSRCAVQLDHQSVSRAHCEITFDGQSYGAVDLGSTNGTYVNDEIIKSRHQLRDGDQIKTGRTILKFIVGGNIEGQYHEEIYRLMTIDGLTQVRNKRYFDEAIEREISRCVRYNRTFSLIMFDIDHFKRINDKFGHLAGDAVLRQLGTLVKGHVRRDDVVCRVGGEEFAIILPEIDVKGAVGVATKLNKLISKTKFSFDDTVIPTTISLGVADWREPFKTAEDIKKRADDKLYEAKGAGRNRVKS